MKRLEVPVGKKFNKLTIVKELPTGPNGRVFECVCDCGNKKQILLQHFVKSKIVSCGCYRNSVNTKHGMWESREYSSWENMIQRCTNPKARKYNLYGGRGITVCDEWLNSFQTFYNDMGERPMGTSLDRIHGDLGYFKDNCKWSTTREQFANLRYFNTHVTHFGVKQTVEQWLIQLNINKDIFKSRVLRGFNFKEALFSEIDIITLDVLNKKQGIYKLTHFLEKNGLSERKYCRVIRC